MSFTIKCFNASTGHVESVSGSFPDFTLEEPARSARRREKLEEFASYDTSTDDIYFISDDPETEVS